MCGGIISVHHPAYSVLVLVPVWLFGMSRTRVLSKRQQRAFLHLYKATPLNLFCPQTINLYHTLCYVACRLFITTMTYEMIPDLNRHTR